MEQRKGLSALVRAQVADDDDAYGLASNSAPLATRAALLHTQSKGLSIYHEHENTPAYAGTERSQARQR